MNNTTRRENHLLSLIYRQVEREKNELDRGKFGRLCTHARENSQARRAAKLPRVTNKLWLASHSMTANCARDSTALECFMRTCCIRIYSRVCRHEYGGKDSCATFCIAFAFIIEHVTLLLSSGTHCQLCAKKKKKKK